MTSSPAPDLHVDIDVLTRLLAEPARWQGVDMHGVWIASTEDGDRTYLRDVLRVLLTELRAAREAAAEALRKEVEALPFRFNNARDASLLASPAPDLEPRFLLTDDPPGPCPYKGCRSTRSPHYSPHFFEAADIEVIEETAYARGHRDGAEKGRAEAAAESGRLREALREIVALCDLSIEDMRNIHGSEQRVLMAVIPARAGTALLATPPAPSDHGALDVERLAEALHAYGGEGRQRLVLPVRRLREVARAVAAEYARLATPSVPPEAGT